ALGERLPPTVLAVGRTPAFDPGDTRMKGWGTRCEPAGGRRAAPTVDPGSAGLTEGPSTGDAGAVTQAPGDLGRGTDQLRSRSRQVGGPEAVGGPRDRQRSDHGPLRAPYRCSGRIEPFLELFDDSDPTITAGTVELLTQHPRVGDGALGEALQGRGPQLIALAVVEMGHHHVAARRGVQDPPVP